MTTLQYRTEENRGRALGRREQRQSTGQKRTEAEHWAEENRGRALGRREQRQSTGQKRTRGRALGRREQRQKHWAEENRGRALGKKRTEQSTGGRRTHFQVTEMDEDPNWMMAELHGRRGYVPENYISLLPHPWFAGRVSRQQAEQRLRWEERGVFLVRESESSPGEFSVSVSYGDMVEHFLVLEGLGQYCVWEETFSSLNRLVDFYRSHSIAQERPVYLTDPPDTPLHTHTPSHTPLHTHTPAHPLTHTAMHLPDPN
ncbi:tyrosine-protein kinase-like, partial [Oncorhynchus kisutch]|uniref:tyrosine-protein kinase-like n=1 Tax=Oncorhynchus kisutch TaxID=8019 RepID=UPI0012DFE0E5